MFDRLLTHISLRRSMAGIYYELRELRRMYASHLTELGVALPSKADDREPATGAADVTDDEAAAALMSLTEEQLAERTAMDVRRAVLEGRDPGTDWRPDPNR